MDEDAENPVSFMSSSGVFMVVCLMISLIANLIQEDKDEVWCLDDSKMLGWRVFFNKTMSPIIISTVISDNVYIAFSIVTVVVVGIWGWWWC
ncbi:hypothetical protein HanRHA438_Chr01g0036911 [Helianthus annuus]|nr:hypothetical protein HanIR_Chr01g0039841 [Helianthus annuus]KAJ0949274.1 hypothetical protein HanRHA438_Chr01g0036911 [Helianthus annuus]